MTSISAERVALVNGGGLDLLSVVSAYVPMEQTKQGLLGKCPFEGCQTVEGRRFTLNNERGFYLCLVCLAQGGPIAFVQQVTGCGFAGAVERLEAFREAQLALFRRELNTE